MHARIEKLDWMGPATKVEALKKLDTYNIKVGYPDHPRDYSKLEIRDDDLRRQCATRGERRLGVLCEPSWRPGRSRPIGV